MAKHSHLPRVTERAIDQGFALGLPGDRGKVASLLQFFSERAALVTHPHGNRRYGGYVLDIDLSTGVIRGVYQYDDYGFAVCSDCFGTGKHDQYDSIESRWVRVPCAACAVELHSAFSV
jgi:hypothetical protein